MGLLDSAFETPSDQALWALASGLFGVRRGQEGKAFMGTLEAYNNAQQQQRRNRLVDMQEKIHAMQLKGMERTQADEDVIRGVAADQSNYMRSPQAAFPPNEMDWQGSPAASPQFDQNMLAQSLLKTGTLAGLTKAIPMLQKDNALTILPADATAIRPNGEVVARGAPKPTNNLNDLIITGQNGLPMINPLVLQARTQIAAAGANAAPMPVSYMPAVNPATGKVEITQMPSRATGGAPVSTGLEPPQAKKGPLPPAMAKIQQELLDQVAGASRINASLDVVDAQILRGDLKLGPVENKISAGKNWAGISDENSRNFSSFMSKLEKMRNESLRLNTGVQTEGDAQRAWNELMANINDPLLVRQRLSEIKGYNSQAALQKLGQLEVMREQFGAEPLTQEQIQKATGVGTTAPAASPSDIPGQGPPKAAIEFLKNNPLLREDFDAKYGKGAAAKVLGY